MMGVVIRASLIEAEARAKPVLLALLRKRKKTSKDRKNIVALRVVLERIEIMLTELHLSAEPV